MATEQQHDDKGRWALGRDTIGPDGSTIYMRRWFFWCPWFGVRLHHILRSDAGRHLHDHPWDFASLLLTGGYTELLPLTDRVTEHGARDLAARGVFQERHHPRWSLVRRRAEDLHRLVLSKPVWTLVLTGPKRKSWGFLTEKGMIPWRQYLGAK